MKKILVVGMADSVHLANWLQNMSALEVQVTLVSSSPHRRIHSKIRELLGGRRETGFSLSMPVWSRRMGVFLWIIDRFVGDRLRGLLLRVTLKEIKPDLVHIVEFQHAGYILLRALARPLTYPRPKLMVSNYGSDIFWFGRFKHHRRKISSLLKLADWYTSECARDIKLANHLGFKGFSILIPNTGGISETLIEEQLKGSKSGSRRILLLKGYQNKFGRALVAVRALWRVRRSLKRIEVVSFSTNLITALALLILRLVSPVRISIFLKGALNHEEVLRLMARSRVYIGVSRSDGISTSLLESMAMGAFTIQTETACASEWIDDESTGAIVSLNNTSNLDLWIKRALVDDSLVNDAQTRNAKAVVGRYTKAIMASRIESLYLEILNSK